MCLPGSCVLRKTLIILTADRWGCVPTLLVVCPEASQQWRLQVLGWDPVFVRKQRPPRGFTPMTTPQNYHHQGPCPCSEPHLCLTSTRVPPILACKSGPVSYEVSSFFACVLVHMGPCVCPPRVEFLFPPVLWNSCDQTPLAFKARFPGAPPPIAIPPGWRAGLGAQTFHSCRRTSVV